MVDIHRVSDKAALTEQAALDFIDLVAAFQAPGGGRHGDGVARVVLTGGSAGIGMLEQLRRFADAAQAQGEDFPALQVDWSRVHVFFGDERNMAIDDPESNEGQARAALLDHVDIPDSHIHGYGLGEADLEQAAADYAAVLNEYAPGGFDLHLLGMGGEGHINSLFPHTPAVREQESLVVAVTDSPKPPAERASLTLPAIRRAEQVWLLVSGQEKAEAAQHVIDRADALEWPAAGAQGERATRLYLADDAAAQ